MKPLRFKSSTYYLHILLTDPKHQVDHLHHMFAVQTQRPWGKKKTKPPSSCEKCCKKTEIAVTRAMFSRSFILSLLVDGRGESILLLTERLM